jgi:PAS domain-containing protein
LNYGKFHKMAQDIIDSEEWRVRLARRTRPVAVNAAAANLMSEERLQELEQTQEPVFILNATRRILYANGAALKWLEVDLFGAIAALRPGEAFGCPNLPADGGGCGSGAACRQCALRALMAMCDATDRDLDHELEQDFNRMPAVGRLCLRVSPLQARGRRYVLVRILRQSVAGLAEPAICTAARAVADSSDGPTG